MDMSKHFTDSTWLAGDPHKHLQFLLTHMYHIATINTCAFRGSVKEDYPFEITMKICSLDTHVETEKTFIVSLEEDPNIQMVKIILEMISDLNLDRPVIHPCCGQPAPWFPLFPKY